METGSESVTLPCDRSLHCTPKPLNRNRPPATAQCQQRRDDAHLPSSGWFPTGADVNMFEMAMSPNASETTTPNLNPTSANLSTYLRYSMNHRRQEGRYYKQPPVIIKCINCILKSTNHLRYAGIAPRSPTPWPVRAFRVAFAA